MKKILLILVFVYSSAFASSGNEVGNGGDAVICLSSNKLENVQLFDFFELANQQGEVIKDRSGTNEQIVKSIILQLKNHDVKLSSILQKRSNEFLYNTQFVSNGSLVDIKDSNNLISIPSKNCKIEQIAIFKKKVLSNEKKFLINEVLWKKLSETHKAGLIIHELIYEYFSDLGEKDSVNARALNTFLFSEKFSKTNTEDYWKFIQSMKVPHYN